MQLQGCSPTNFFFRQKESVGFFHDYMYSVHMSDIRFEWDERKNRANKRKHKKLALKWIP